MWGPPAAGLSAKAELTWDLAMIYWRWLGGLGMGKMHKPYLSLGAMVICVYTRIFGMLKAKFFDPCKQFRVTEQMDIVQYFRKYFVKTMLGRSSLAELFWEPLCSPEHCWLLSSWHVNFGLLSLSKGVSCPFLFILLYAEFY